MLRWSIQLIKAMLLCIEYGILFVNTVDIHREKLLGWLLKKVMGSNTLEILMSSVDSVDIYSISASAFQNFLQIENQLNIKKVMGRNVWMCFVSTVSI